MKINVKVDSSGVKAALGGLRRSVSDLAPVLSGIGASIVADAQMRFKGSRDPYGQPWRPLSKRTIAQRRGHSDKPLLDTGRLRNSLSFRLVGEDAVHIGSNAAYAAVHQFGNTTRFAARSILVRLRKVRVKREDGTSYLATRFAADRHKRAVSKWGTNAGGWSVTIPARPFLATRERGLPREYGEAIRDQLRLHFRAQGAEA